MLRTQKKTMILTTIHIAIERTKHLPIRLLVEDSSHDKMAESQEAALTTIGSIKCTGRLKCSSLLVLTSFPVGDYNTIHYQKWNYIGVSR